jgi:hypothetical protein
MSQSSKIVDTEEGPQEWSNYNRGMVGLDFGLLNARNQLILKVINPILDELIREIKLEHLTDSSTVYDVALLIQSKRDIEPQINGAVAH